LKNPRLGASSSACNGSADSSAVVGSPVADASASSSSDSSLSDFFSLLFLGCFSRSSSTA